MTLPAEKARLLDEIAALLATVPNMAAVALGGSHARGTHGPASDLDIGLYYREGSPFPVDDVREIARRFSASGSPTVTGFYDWGPFVNGGAWIDNAICKVDFLYRNLDHLERIVAAAERGEWQHSFDQQPPFGFRSVTTLGEIQCAGRFTIRRIFWAPEAAAAIFPPATQSAHRSGHALVRRVFISARARFRESR